MFRWSDGVQTALSALQYALNTNTGSIDVLAYSGGASDYTLAFNLLSSSQQDRIATTLHFSWNGWYNFRPKPRFYYCDTGRQWT